MFPCISVAQQSLPSEACNTAIVTHGPNHQETQTVLLSNGLAKSENNNGLETSEYKQHHRNGYSLRKESSQKSTRPLVHSMSVRYSPWQNSTIFTAPCATAVRKVGRENNCRRTTGWRQTTDITLKWIRICLEEKWRTDTFKWTFRSKWWCASSKKVHWWLFQCSYHWKRKVTILLQKILVYCTWPAIIFLGKLVPQTLHWFVEFNQIIFLIFDNDSQKSFLFALIYNDLKIWLNK